MENHNCTKIIEQIYAMLDGELPAQEETILMQEIEKCLYCIESFELEKKFKQYIADRIERKVLPAQIMKQVILVTQ